MVYTQTRIRPGEWDTQNSQGIWDTNRSPNPGQKSRPRESLQEKPCWTVDFTVKENEKRDEYLDLAKK